MVFRVLNRGVGYRTLFEKADDYLWPRRGSSMKRFARSL
jgi:hypothetical protein